MFTFNLGIGLSVDVLSYSHIVKVLNTKVNNRALCCWYYCLADAGQQRANEQRQHFEALKVPLHWNSTIE